MKLKKRLRVRIIPHISWHQRIPLTFYLGEYKRRPVPKWLWGGGGAESSLPVVHPGYQVLSALTQCSS